MPRRSVAGRRSSVVGRRLRVAFYCPLDFAALSGVPMLAATLARALGERGHRVEIFARGGNGELGVAFREIEAWEPAGFDVVHTFGSYSLSGRQVRRCREAGARVVHSYVLNVVALAARSGRLLRQLRRGWYRECVWNELRAGRLADAVTVVSRRVAAEIGWLYGLPRWKMALLPNCHTGATADPEAAAHLRRRFGFDERHLVFLFAGRDEDPIKRAGLVQECFLRVQRDFPETRLWMMPGGSSAGHPAIVPAGRLSVAEGDRIYEAADVFVNASAYDGMPISVLQALAAGLPTIATAAGGSEEVIVDGRDGLLLPRSAEGLEAAMRRLIGDTALRATLSTAARARSCEFAPGVVAAQLEEIYRSLIGAVAESRTERRLHAYHDS